MKPSPITIHAWCFAAGTIVGCHVSATHFHFLLAALATLGCLAAALLRHNTSRKAVAAGFLLVTFLLGGARMKIAQSSPSSHTGRPGREMPEAARRVGQAMTARLQAAGLSDQELHLMEALLWGRRTGLSPHTKTLFRRTGSSHLLAISGTHLGIFYWLISLLCVRWLAHTRWRWIMFPAVVASLWAYATICGFPASLVRAATMLSLHCMGRMCFRSMPLQHSLGLSILIILSVRPMQVLDIGFQLSCLALLWIGLLLKPLSMAWSQWPRIFHGPASLLGMGFCAQMGTMAVSAYYFHSISLLGPFFGLLAMPLTTVMMCGGLLTLLLPHPAIGHVLQTCIRWQTKAMELFSQHLPGAMMEGLHPTLGQTLAIYAVLLTATIFIRRQALRKAGEGDYSFRE